MVSGSSWSRFPPITLSGGISDRFHLQDDDRYAACADGGHALARQWEGSAVSICPDTLRCAGITAELAVGEAI